MAGLFGNVASFFGGGSQGTQVAAAPGAPQNNVQQAQAPAPAPQPQSQQNNPMGQNNPSAVPPGAPQAGTNPDGTPKQDANPLDNFSNIWEAPKNDGNQPVDPLSTPLLNSDPAKIAAAANKMNFTQGVPQELMSRVMAGNDPAALVELINHVGRQSLITAAQLSTATVENATRLNNDRMLSVLPKHVNNIQLSQLPAENPALSHPAAVPMLQVVRQQIKANNPTMTPAEINARAEQYLTNFASAISGGGNAGQQGSQQQGSQGQQEQDWSIFL